MESLNQCTECNTVSDGARQKQNADSVQTMSEWKFDANEVLRDSDGYLWHVMKRYEDIDGKSRLYELADATHTEYRNVNAEDVEEWEHHQGKYESDGWSCKTKPAVKRGIRMNGVLADPQSVEYWRGSGCIHSYPCSSCEAENEDVDVCTTRNYVLTDCRECDNWEIHEL